MAATTASPRIDLLALGEGMVEFNQAAGAQSDTFLRGSGGDTSNVVIAAARLARDVHPPVRVGYLTRVGDDAFGAQLLELWRSEGVETGGVEVDAEAPTGVYFVTHDDRGHAFSYLRTGSAASRMRPCDRHDRWIGAARVLHVSGISQAISTSACDAVFAAIETAHARGVRVSYDPNLRLRLWPLARARAVVLATLGQCNVFLPSLDEARMLSGLDSPEAIVAWSHSHGAAVVALKCGTEGVLVSDGARTQSYGGHRVDSVDATGAGDCFDGAFNMRLIAGDDPFAAAAYANAAAALATTGYGAVAPLPRDADVRGLMNGDRRGL